MGLKIPIESSRIECEVCSELNILLFNGGTSNKNTKLLTINYKQICESRGHNVVVLDSYFRDCMNCSKCFDTGKCCIPDTLTTTLEKTKFDCVVIGTPLYFYHMSAKAKAFLDRLYSLDKTDLIFSLICVCGSPYEESGIDLIEESMIRTCEYCGSYLTPTFYKVTNDEFTGIVTEEDKDNLVKLIEETEVIFNEVKENSSKDRD